MKLQRARLLCTFTHSSDADLPPIRIDRGVPGFRKKSSSGAGNSFAASFPFYQDIGFVAINLHWK